MQHIPIRWRGQYIVKNRGLLFCKQTGCLSCIAGDQLRLKMLYRFSKLLAFLFNHLASNLCVPRVQLNSPAMTPGAKRSHQCATCASHWIAYHLRASEGYV